MPDSEETVSQPRTAFALLGHELRLEILLALLDRWQAAHTEPQRYSDLMRAVGMQDSGKFNYHLKKLRGVYLEKVGEGYVPTASATALYRAVLAHRPTQTPSQTQFEPEIDCPECGEDLIATYEREFFSVACGNCEDVIDGFTYPLPENAVQARTDREVLRAVYDRARAHVWLARRGQCPDCAGTTTISISHDEIEVESGSPVEIACDTCTWTVQTGFLLPLLGDASVTGVLTECGITIEGKYPWELPEPGVVVVESDPVRFELVFMTESGDAVVTVDQQLTVLSTTVRHGDQTNQM